jgi:hypothetical protein
VSCPVIGSPGARAQAQDGFPNALVAAEHDADLHGRLVLSLVEHLTRDDRAEAASGKAIEHDIALVLARVAVTAGMRKRAETSSAIRFDAVKRHRVGRDAAGKYL